MTSSQKSGLNGWNSWIIRILNYMKSLVSKFFALLICTFTLSAGLAFAQLNSQLEEKNLPVGEFNIVSASGDFDVTVEKGSYGVRITTEEVLAPYVQVYVRSHTLYISYDAKSVPKDLKKQFKGRKNPDPVFRAVVFMPELNGVLLSDNATLMGTQEFAGSAVSINLSDKAQIKNLTLNCKSVNVHMKKNALAALTLNADDKIDLYTDGNASLKLTTKTHDMVLTAEGSSQLAITAETRGKSTFNLSGSSQTTANLRAPRVTIQAAGSSELVLNGDAQNLSVFAERNSEVDANGLQVRKAEANLSGSARVNVNVMDELTATAVGGSALYYRGTPEIKVGKIIKSTLAPFGATSK